MSHLHRYLFLVRLTVGQGSSSGTASKIGPEAYTPICHYVQTPELIGPEVTYGSGETKVRVANMSRFHVIAAKYVAVW